MATKKKSVNVKLDRKPSCPTLHQIWRNSGPADFRTEPEPRIKEPHNQSQAQAPDP